MVLALASCGGVKTAGTPVDHDVKATRETMRAHAPPPEVTAWFSEFALREEQYRLEMGSYMSTGGSERDTWPLGAGDARTGSTDHVPATWTKLRIVRPGADLTCGYVAIAGPSGGGIVGPIAAAAPFRVVPSTTPWYYVLARCPSDRFYLTSRANPTFQRDAPP